MPTYDGTYGITSGPDGNMWVTERTPKIARVTTAGVVTEFFPTDIPINIKAGADGNLWFTEAQSIGRSTVGGSIVEFPLASPSAGAWDITKGRDGNMWFTETGVNKIGRITPAGVIEEFDVPSSPYGIVTGPDGNIWFTEPSAGRVARFITP
jgi:virginiamycin B lyase